MSNQTVSLGSQPASTNGHRSETDRVFIVEVKGSEYRINASDRTSAKYRAASAHKEQQQGPDVGQTVGEIAGIASIIGSLRAD